LNLPNLLSLIRIALVPVFFTLIILPSDYAQARWWAIAVFSFASVTDALDGYFARTWKQVTGFGEKIDPLADKLLILSGVLALHLTLQPVFVPPIWITCIIFLRETVFTGGLITFLLSNKKMPARPNLLGKATTLLQMTLVLSCLLNFPFSIYIAVVAGLFTVASGFFYTFRGARYLAGKGVL